MIASPSCQGLHAGWKGHWPALHCTEEGIYKPEREGYCPLSQSNLNRVGCPLLVPISSFWEGCLSPVTPVFGAKLTFRDSDGESPCGVAHNSVTYTTLALPCLNLLGHLGGKACVPSLYGDRPESTPIPYQISPPRLWPQNRALDAGRHTSPP